MEIFFILLIPLLLMACALAAKKIEELGYACALGYLAVFLLSLSLAATFLSSGAPISYFNFFYADALSVLFVLLISLVSFCAAVYSIGYIACDLQKGVITFRKARVYYLLFNAFCLSMLAVPLLNNMGMLWAAVELTTLVSTFLVGFYTTKHSVEAAWKYIIICSVGIILALLGTILFVYAVFFSSGLKSLNWTDMMACTGSLDKNILQIAFIFILVGYGTKAGLAPMHTWLPDAHSQAVSPVSALLSGVLIKTALYALLRYCMIVNKGMGTNHAGNYLIFFGLLSMAVAGVLILVQKDLKRFLAYSSVEHIGVICVGLGLGSAIALYGALLHVFNHAITKSLMFLGAGSIIKRYDKHNINAIRGVIAVMPFTGVLFFLGMFALAGFPPFSIFISEALIVISAFLAKAYWPAGLALFFIALIFAAMILRFPGMLFGQRPPDQEKTPEPLSTKLSLGFLLALACLMGFWVPGPFGRLLDQAVGLLRGV